jgi:hypothetical protein
METRHRMQMLMSKNERKFRDEKKLFLFDRRFDSQGNGFELFFCRLLQEKEDLEAHHRELLERMTEVRDRMKHASNSSADRNKKD